METLPEEFNNSRPLSVMYRGYFYGLAIVLFLVLIYFFVFSAPKEFPVGEKISVPNGANLRDVSLVFEERKVIRSRAAFEFFVILFGNEKKIVSADYSFNQKLSVLGVAKRIAVGTYRTAPVSVTIPEGFDRGQISDSFARELQNFNKERFLENTKNLEGYLFPDTYFFFTEDNEDAVIKSMSSNFKKKISSFEKDIQRSGKSEKEIITMASLVEREAKGEEDRDIIAGILWKRLSIGMALQVDAAPETYKTKGLPLAPISNPGIKAIRAALDPENTPYLYYLHDKEGKIHYAESFSEHTKNVSEYLK